MNCPIKQIKGGAACFEDTRTNEDVWLAALEITHNDGHVENIVGGTPTKTPEGQKEFVIHLTTKLGMLMQENNFEGFVELLKAHDFVMESSIPNEPPKPRHLSLVQ